MDIIVGIGDYAYSNKQSDYLKTYALATCVGVTVYCPVTLSAGMVHIVLPDHRNSSSYISKAGYFANIGVPLLITKMQKAFGCQTSDLKVQLFGGANSINQNDCFMIGSKNVEAISAVLHEMGISCHRTSVGGNVSRTITLSVATGVVTIASQPLKF